MFPILFEIGPVTLQSFWVFASLGLLTGAYTFAKLAKKSRLKLDWISEKIIPLLLVTLIASRLTFVVLHFDLYKGNQPSFISFDSDLYKRIPLQIFYLWDQGFSFWGGCGAFLLLFIHYARQRKEPLQKWFDCLAPAFFIGFVLGDIGAFLDGRNHGHETNLPWGINFKSPEVKYAVPIHPTQLYAALFHIVIFATTISLFKKFANVKPALVTFASLTLGGFFRFIEEFFRGDEVLMISETRIPQILALLIFVYGASQLLLLRKRHIHQNPLP